MIREVVGNLLCGQVNPIHKLLVMRVSSLGGSQYFGNVVDWALDFVGIAFFFPLDREYSGDNFSSGCDVQ